MIGADNQILHTTESHVDFITFKAINGTIVLNEKSMEQLLITINNSINSDSRAVVIQGSEGVFCKGLDFKEVLAKKDSINEEWAKPYIDIIDKIYNSPKPFIACVDGDVAAGGMGILLACDCIIATEKSNFALTEVLFGLIPAMVLPLLLKRVPEKKAINLIVTARNLRASEALIFGIVDDLVIDHIMLKKKCKEYLKRILFASPDALSNVKKYVNNLQQNLLYNQLNKGLLETVQTLNDKNVLNGISKFMDGEMPEWSKSFKYPKKKEL